MAKELGIIAHWRVLAAGSAGNPFHLRDGVLCFHGGVVNSARVIFDPSYAGPACGMTGCRTCCPASKA